MLSGAIRPTANAETWPRAIVQAIEDHQFGIVVQRHPPIGQQGQLDHRDCLAAPRPLSSASAGLPAAMSRAEQPKRRRA